jgi:ribonuclease HI
VAEYEALLHVLRVAKELGNSRVLCFGDSDLVAQQRNETWDTKTPMAAYRRRTTDEFYKCFIGYEANHIPRAENEAVDALAKIGSRRHKVSDDVFLEHLHVPSIKGAYEDSLEAPDTPSAAVFLVTPNW